MRSLRFVLLAVTLFWFRAGRAAAQTTYDACYVPSVGAIYLIKQAGLPTACLAQSHVVFSWTSGGTVADGSVTLAKLAFDPATQAELNTVLSQLAAIGTINTSANPVDWTQLKNVPAGLADGVDDGGGAASDVVCASCVAASDLASNAVTTAKITNGAVTSAKLDFDPATQSELDAVTAGLAVPGTINTSTNPLDWTRLKNVPPDLADGLDDAGRISGYERVLRTSTIPPGQHRAVGVSCPAGKKAVGGGFQVSSESSTDLIIIEASFPDSNGTSWLVSYVSNRSITVDVVTFAVCVDAS